MKKYLLYLCIVALAIFGCKNKVSDTQAAVPTLENISNGLSLNNGQKWQVNRAMAVHLTEMESDIDKFKSGDIHILQRRLQDNLSQLTSKCTMVGQAHDELHHWLIPLIDHVKDLHNQDIKQTVQTLKMRFEVYHTYFESA